MVIGALEASEEHGKIDALERHMLSVNDPVDFPLVHRFLPGMYIREIFMPAGSIAVSKTHKTEHPYVVLKGVANVYIPGVGVERVEAGRIGVTQPGTRRVLHIIEDSIWVTFHPRSDDETTVEQIEDRIIEKRTLPDGTNTFEQWQKQLAAKALQEEA